jgi:hypothetical protein
LLLRKVRSTYRIFNHLIITLRFKKSNSYMLWKEVDVRISNREHLNPQLRPLLKEMASKINNTV